MNARAVETVVRERLGLDPAALGPHILERAVEARIRARGLIDPALYTARLMTDVAERNALAAELAVSETWFFRGGRALFERLGDRASHAAAAAGDADMQRRAAQVIGGDRRGHGALFATG